MITSKLIEQLTLQFISVGGKIEKVDLFSGVKLESEIDLELIDLCDLQNQLTRPVFSTITTENQRRTIE